MILPGLDLRDEPPPFANPAVQALAAQHADLDLHHVEPAGVLGGVVEFDALQNAMRFGRRERIVQCSRGVRREIVQNNADKLRLRIVRVDEIAHAFGEVLRRPLLRDLHMAPASVCVEEDEQVGGAVAAIFAIVSPRLSRRRRDRLAHLADQLRRALVEADYRTFWIGFLGVEIEHVFHSRDILAINPRDAPHVAPPRLEVILFSRRRTVSRDCPSCLISRII